MAVFAASYLLFDHPLDKLVVVCLIAPHVRQVLILR